jgi:hypothetical protein
MKYICNWFFKGGNLSNQLSRKCREKSKGEKGEKGEIDGKGQTLKERSI